MILINRRDLSKFSIHQIKITTHGFNRTKERFDIDKSDFLAEVFIKNKIIWAIKYNDFYNDGNKVFLNSQLKDKHNKELYFVLKYKENELLLITLKPTSVQNKLDSI